MKNNFTPWVDRMDQVIGWKIPVDLERDLLFKGKKIILEGFFLNVFNKKFSINLLIKIIRSTRT